MPLELNVLPESEVFALSDARAKPEPPPAIVDPTAPLKGGEMDRQFERVWQAHPKALERKESRAQFGRLKPTIALVDKMLAAIEVQKRSDQWQRGFIAKLSNWLKDHRWEDRLAAAGAQPVVTDRNQKNLGAAQRFAERRRQQEPQ